jgi:signal transduction histidine kinase
VVRAADQLAGRLGAVALFATLTAGQLAWLAERGGVRDVPAGTVLARQGDPADGFHVVLDGRTDWSREVGGREVHAVTLGPGEIFAELILLLDQPYPTTGRAVDDTTLFSIDPDGFWEMLGVCPQVLRGVVGVAVERAELHEGVSQQQARLLSLGTIAAGLAHELNNPAAAARSASRALAEPLREAPRRAARLGPAAVDELDALLTAAAPPAGEGALERADREDALLDWLEERAVPEATALAAVLADAGVERDALAARLAPDAVPDAAGYLAATLSARELAATLDDATARMSRLVGAMRTFSRMDTDHVAEPIDVREGLDATLTLLAHEIADRRITLVRHEEPGLPRVTGSAGDLNQVWANLVDNALRAVAEGGTIAVTARAEPEAAGVVVEVADDGVGIPEEVAGRVFEPFFTTRGVGEGTGLGLDHVRRVVAQHGGEVRFTSRPGDTRFLVRLPAADGAGAPVRPTP